MKICSGNRRLRTTSLTPWSKLFPQKFTVVETFNRFIVVYVMRYLRPEVQEAEHSNLCRILAESYTAHFRVLLSTNRTQKRTLSSTFSDKTFVWISKFPNARLQWPRAVNNRGRFQAVWDAVQDASPHGYKAQRHSVTSTCILSNTKLNAFLAVFIVPSRKIPVNYVRIDEDLLGFLYVCFADPWKLCTSGHILDVWVADPWKLPL